MIRRLWPRRAEKSAPPAGNAPAADPPLRLGPFALHPPRGEADRQLLLAAYASSREDDAELALRHPDSKRAVIEHEFDSRQLGYPVDFPGVEYFLLRLDDAPAGRLYLQSAPTFVFVVDLVLLPPWRGQGRGTALLRDLIAHAHAAGRVVRLHVAKNNPRAAALYRRLGFQTIGELTHHFLLELAPKA